MKPRAVFLAIIAASFLGLTHSITPTQAATPTPQASATTAVTSTTPTPSTTPLAFVANFGLDISAVSGLISSLPVVKWQDATPGAGYHLTGQLFIVRVSASDPFCTPASLDERTTVSVDQTLGQGVTQASVTFPPVDGSDAWFAYDVRLTLSAIGQDGLQRGAQRANGILESACARQPLPTTKPVSTSITLPTTGVEDRGGAGEWQVVAMLLLSLGAAAISLGTIGRWVAMRFGSGHRQRHGRPLVRLVKAGTTGS